MYTTLNTLFPGVASDLSLAPVLVVEKDGKKHKQDVDSLAAFRADFTRLEAFLNADLCDLSYDDCASYAVTLARCLRLLGGARRLVASDVHAVSLRVLGAVIRVKHDDKPSSDPRYVVAMNALIARAFDSGFWRSRLYVRSLQLREFRAMQASRLGKDCPYATPYAVEARRLQRAKQAEWLKATTLTCAGLLDENGQPVELPLEKVAKTAKQSFSGVYAMVEAIDVLAQEQQLECALITVTLPGDWHSNPTYKRKGWQFNGKTPKQASDEIGKRWEKVRLYLDNRGVYLTGIWVLEMHKDGTPHRHYLVHYRPEHRAEVMATFLKWFPNRLKLRFGSDKSLDCGFTSPEDCRAGRSYSLGKPTSPFRRLGYAVDVAIINRSESKPASYVFKYLEKTLLVDDALKDTSFASVDAARFVWRLRAYQFFGVNGSREVWDRLRSRNTAPEDAVTRELWVAARGGDKEGRIQGGEQRGDAVQFLRLVGGLKACHVGRVSRPKAGATREVVKVARESVTTRYQEEGKRAVGLVRVLSVFGLAEHVDPETGEVLTGMRWQVRDGAFTRTKFYDWQLKRVAPAASAVAPAVLAEPAATATPRRRAEQLELL